MFLMKGSAYWAAVFAILPYPGQETKTPHNNNLLSKYSSHFSSPRKSFVATVTECS
jgi:hypothetical protein